MAKDNNLQDFLTDVANAIREKKGTSELINPQDFSAEIESIQTGGLEEKVVVEVPEELQGFSAGSNKQLYTFDLEDGTYLVSDSYSKTLWYVDKTANLWTRLRAEYMTNAVYNTFCKIDDRVIITAGGSNGVSILYFDITTKTIGNVLKSDGGIYNDPVANFVEVGDKVLMGGNSTRISVYDRTSKIIVNQLSAVGFVSVSPNTTKVWNNKALINRTQSIGTSYVYNAETNEFIEFTQPVEWNMRLSALSQYENIVALGGYLSTDYGLVVFNFDTMTFEKPSHTTIDTLYVNRALVTSDKKIVCGKNNTNGVFVYDTTLGSYVAENTSSAIGDTQNIFEVDDYVLYSRSSSSGGLWQYNKVSNTISQLYASKYDFIFRVKVQQPNRALIGREGYGFIYSFNNGVLSSNLYGAGSSYTYEIVSNTENEIIINNTNFNVQIKYDVETDTITPIGVIL